MKGRVSDIAEDGSLLLSGGGRVGLDGILPDNIEIRADVTLRQVLAGLAKGNDVELRFFTKKPPRPDRHGRLPAQVVVEGASGPVWLQGQLVLQGLARVHALKDNRTCSVGLLALEKQARAKRRGYWRSGDFAVHDAQDVAVLQKLFDTFQIVEGRVLSVGRRRRETFLNFGPVWKKDFTVIIPAAIAARLIENGVALDHLERQRIRVRGYLVRRGGPALLLDVAEHLEVLEQG